MPSAKGEAICYFQTANGQTIDLSVLCGSTEQSQLARLDQGFLDLLASAADEDALKEMKLVATKPLPQLGRQVCAELDRGTPLEAIARFGTTTNLPPTVLFSLKAAAVQLYCPQYINAIVRGRRND